ncbi:MAG: glycosyltransferase family 2 protein [Planctomycetes bacterium]|nr:glycosyltransferase family 2 protein [Planctomycetota bacterium]
MPTLSIVAPAYNEAELVGEFVRRVRTAVEPTGLDFEIVLVDDGSRDEMYGRIEALHAGDHRVKAVRLSRNFGQEAAIQAGLQFASGDAVVLMDADLQDPPELLPEMIAKWKEGVRVVLAERMSRGESWPRRTATRLFHWLFRRLSRSEERGDVGLFSLVDRRVVDTLRQMPERHRYLRGLRAYVGFSRASVSYERPRREGQPRQSLGKLIRLAADSLFSFSSVPLRMSLFMGLIVSALCMSYALFLVVLRILSLCFPDSPFGQFEEAYGFTGFTTIAVAILFLGGVQLIAIGIIGEYLGRIYEEVKRRPNYVVERTLGLEVPADQQRG